MPSQKIAYTYYRNVAAARATRGLKRRPLANPGLPPCAIAKRLRLRRESAVKNLRSMTDL